MSETLNCTSCRSPIVIPNGHDGATIRCGICWSEVPLPKAPVVPVIRPAVALPPPASKPPAVGGAAPKSGFVRPPGVQVAAPLPDNAKPAAGMARLEALLHTTAIRLRPATIPMATKVGALPTSAAATVLAPQVPMADLTPTPSVPAEAIDVVEPEIVAEVPDVMPSIAPAFAPVSAAAVAANPPVLSATGERARAGRQVDDDRSERKKSRFRSRDERDEDDDEHPRRRESKGGSMAAVLVGAGVFLLILLLGGGYLVYSLMSDSPDDLADNQPGQAGNNFNPQPNPNPLPPFRVPDPAPVENNPPQPRPNPNQIPNPLQPNNPFPDPFPQPRNPAQELVWNPVVGADGFEAQVPGEVKQSDHWDHVFNAAGPRAGFVKADGKKYTASSDRWYTFEVQYVDLAAGFKADHKRMITPFPNFQNAIQPAQFAGLPGLEYSRQSGPVMEEKRLVQVGNRVYVFYAKTFPVANQGRDEQHAEQARKKFFDSVKITFAGGGVNPGGLDAAPGGIGVGAGDALPAAARLDPFWTSVVLPGRGEVLVFGTRPGGKGGTVRRYTYPAFTPKNTYHTPNPVTFAAVDEKANRLVVTTMTKPDGSQRDVERQVHIGDVQVYDLKPIFDGSVAERDELRPLDTVRLGAKLAGLEVANGKAYVLSLFSQPANRTRPWRTKLTQIDIETRKLEEMELPDPAWRIKLSPDRKRLYAAEVPIAAAPGGVARAVNILVVDVKNWKREKTHTVPGVAVDLAIAEEGPVLASVSQGRDFKLYAIQDNGQTVDLNPADGQPVTLGYAALTPDGKRLVTSASAAVGVQVYEITNLDGPAGLKRVADAKAVKLPNAADAQVPVGGHFTISPDGKFALFQVGVVLDLTKLQGN